MFWIMVRFHHDNVFNLFQNYKVRKYTYNTCNMKTNSVTFSVRFFSIYFLDLVPELKNNENVHRYSVFIVTVIGVSNRACLV